MTQPSRPTSAGDMLPQSRKCLRDGRMKEAHGRPRPRRRASAWGSRRLALVATVVFLASVWMANARICPGCRVIPLHVELSDGSRVRARLYIPTDAVTPMPAVVVCHGYLANLAFLEIPWAADLTHLGAAALFLDRRGHGRSNGSYWPRTNAQPLNQLEPDLAAAIGRPRQVKTA